MPVLVQFLLFRCVVCCPILLQECIWGHDNRQFSVRVTSTTAMLVVSLSNLNQLLVRYRLLPLCTCHWCSGNCTYCVMLASYVVQHKHGTYFPCHEGREDCDCCRDVEEVEEMAYCTQHCARKATCTENCLAAACALACTQAHLLFQFCGGWGFLACDRFIQNDNRSVFCDFLCSSKSQELIIAPVVVSKPGGVSLLLQARSPHPLHPEENWLPGASS